MKGPNIVEELNQSEKAIKILGLKIDKIENLKLPSTDITRNIVIFNKVGDIGKNYPRQNGKIRKNPL